VRGAKASDWYVFNLGTGTKAEMPNRATAAVAMAHPVSQGWDPKAKGTEKSQFGKGKGTARKAAPAKGKRGTKATAKATTKARRGTGAVATRKATPKERKAMAAAKAKRQAQVAAAR
jgi:hypothetical protein